jgi:GntR family transcriptional regulator / MocR family aminotransferase
LAIAGSHASRRGAPDKARASPGWADLYDWHAVERAQGMSVVHQTYLQVRSAILSGSLQAGTKLPSSRDLASKLEVARSSVVEAYEQLLAEGYLSTRRGSGTFISSDLPEPIETAPRVRKSASNDRRPTHRSDATEPLDHPAYSDTRPFNTGRTLLDARTREVWRRLTHRAARALGPGDLGYSDPRGSLELRRAVCDYLQAARAVRCEPEQVVVTGGTQHAIDIVIRVLLRPGEQVWVEDPGYPLTRQALTAAGLVARPVPVDAHGMNVSAGVRSAPHARAAFVTPSHQFPTGVVLSMSRRLELLAWARESKSWIIEDDYASEFRYSGRPLSSLQGLDDNARVIYVGTLNKALFPGLRLGYAVVPTLVLKAFVEARHLMDRQPPSLHQSVVAEFMRQGHLSAHIRRMRLQYRAQRDVLAAELTRHAGDLLAVEVPDQGMHLLADIRGGLSDVAVERAACAGGVVVRSISRLYTAAPPRSALMLGFSGSSCQSIVPAARRLARILDRQALSKGAATSSPYRPKRG